MVVAELLRELKSLCRNCFIPGIRGYRPATAPLIFHFWRLVCPAKFRLSTGIPWRRQDLENIMPKDSYYAVARGRATGIFKTWDECKAQVDKFTGARFKKFQDPDSANAFIAENQSSAGAKSTATVKAKVAGSASFKSSTSSISSSTTTTTNFFGELLPTRTPVMAVAPGPAWRSGFQSLRKPLSTDTGIGFQHKSISNQQPSRPITTSATNSKRHMKVTEDRVVGIKRRKSDGEPVSYNVGVDLSQFKTDEEGYVVVYTDGACTGNGKKGAAAGIGVWFDDGHHLNISEPVKGRRQTNNVAEIQAAERAVSQAKQVGIDKLSIKTDSQFTINCMTKWVHGWKQNNWKSKTGEAVKNRDDLEKLISVSKNVQIKWSYVPGHKGHYGNEQADRLAVRGAHS